MAIRIAVVEDDPFTRLTLVEALRAQGIEVVLATASATEALRQVPGLGVHAVFLDLHLGAGPTGIDLAIALRNRQPRLGIVLLTTFDDPRLLSSTLPEPPPGTCYVTKRSLGSVEELIATLRDAITAISTPATPAPDSARSTSGTSTAQRLSDDRTGSSGSGDLRALSDVQIETLRLVARGLSNAEIARRRQVTDRAVEAAIARLARHLGVSADAASNQRVHLAQVYFRSLGLPVDGP
jgi:DNA-binding NarL/FixJ family response regulator